MNNRMGDEPLSEIVSICCDVSTPYLISAKTLNGNQIQALQRHLVGLGFYVGLIDALSGGDEASLITALDNAFQFPNYFGNNWNAVDECLADMSWLPAKGYCCILSHAQVLRDRDKRIYDLFLDSFRYAADRWQPDGVPFKLVLS